MVNTEFAKIAEIGGGLIWNVVYWILGIAVVVIAYFVTRWFQKNSRRQKSFTIQADIVDMAGVVDFDKVGFTKSEKTGLLEMIFQKRKQDSLPPIPKHLIRGGRVMLLNYAPGHYCVVDTAKTMKNVSQGKSDIVLYNLGMKKYIMAKQREILNKQQDKLSFWDNKAPWLVLGISFVVAVVIAAVIFTLGAKFDAQNVAARMAECTGVLG